MILLGVLITLILPAQGVYSLWGMTYSGGTAGGGVIFRTSNRGNNFQKIHDFDEEEWDYIPGDT